jgi:hypothetical protein
MLKASDEISRIRIRESVVGICGFGSVPTDPQHCLADKDIFSYFATGAGTTLKMRCWF